MRVAGVFPQHTMSGVLHVPSPAGTCDTPMHGYEPAFTPDGDTDLRRDFRDAAGFDVVSRSA